jgi:hypothetical protein
MKQIVGLLIIALIVLAGDTLVQAEGRHIRCFDEERSVFGENTSRHCSHDEDPD